MANAAKKGSLMRIEIYPLDFESNRQWLPLNKNSYSGMIRQKSVSTSHPNIQSQPGSDPKPPLQP